MKTMAEVLAHHAVAGMSGGTHLACRCNRTWVLHAEYLAHLEEALTAEGYGPVREAKATVLREAADKIMGPSDVPLDAATCRWNAIELRERADRLATQ